MQVIAEISLAMVVVLSLIYGGGNTSSTEQRIDRC